jgi:mRNA-degrading endonuclease RelE of RelBE toxin-antitoxin system
MKLFFTERFQRDYTALPRPIQTQVDKQLGLFLSNPRHPSLRVKKIQGTGGRIFEGRITRGYRFTFEIAGDSYILRRVGQHDPTLKKP